MTIDASKFKKNERPNEYEARFSVSGYISVTFKAGSPEEAKLKAEAMLDDEEFGLELDDVSDVSLDHMMKTRPLFLVTRSGQKMQTSWLKEGDEPREADERGF
jgi:hypothetical protein